MKMMRCPECGERAPRYARRCGSCGQRLAPSRSAETSLGGNPVDTLDPLDLLHGCFISVDIVFLVLFMIGAIFAAIFGLL
jgi:hypothetical protein